MANFNYLKKKKELFFAFIFFERKTYLKENMYSF